MSNDVFVWSACHGHHHVANFASYELIGATGTVLTGRKQAFCLQDVESIQVGAPSAGYTCDFQGISPGWADVYGHGLTCQWIDVTGIAPGRYTLRVVVNPLRTIVEARYDNDVFEVAVDL
jgi:Lysyl oxidase